MSQGKVWLPDFAPGARIAAISLPLLGICAFLGGTASAGEAKGAKPRHFSEVGQASWYDYRERGARRTASGRNLDNRLPTAAHKSLPFNARVRVTNMRNGKSVVVVINDRGPYHGGRIIDLSRQAAQQIGIIQTGVGKVRVERVVEVAENRPDP